MKWVRLKKYCEISGDSEDAVHQRRKKGVWIDEIQCRIAPDKKLWVNTDEVDRWVEHGSKSILEHCRQG